MIKVIKSMARIAFLLGSFFSGGIGRVTSVLTNEMVKNFDVDIQAILYFKQDKAPNYIVNENIKQHYLLTEQVSLSTAILRKHIISKLCKIIRDEEISILICCDAIHFVYGILACKRAKIKCICWEHTSPFISSDHKFQNLCRIFGIRYCDKYVVLTKYAENYYVGRYPKYKSKIIHLYNPIDEKAQQSKAYDSKSKKIISVGRLTYPKNYERLLLIASKVLPNNPGWEWDIYGDGPQKSELESLIAKYGLQKQVHLMGQVSDIYSQYMKYSFLVMTSRYEGFPMSLIEAAANRIPLICFDIPTGPNEIIIDGINGFLVDSNSDESMINKIQQLIDDTQLRCFMSKEVYRLTNEFELKRIVMQWISLVDIL